MVAAGIGVTALIGAAFFSCTQSNKTRKLAERIATETARAERAEKDARRAERARAEADGRRAKYEAQCESGYGSTNDDGSYTCRTLRQEGERCFDGEDAGCVGDGMYCAHGGGSNTTTPLGGDAGASDAVLYPFVCCKNKWTVTDEWCEGIVPHNRNAKYEAQCTNGYGTSNGDGSYTCKSGKEGEECHSG